MDWNKILNIDIDSDIKTIKKAYANLLKENNPEEKSESLSDEIDKFLGRLNEIYSDVLLRLDLKNWKELFNMGVVWNAESTSIIAGQVFEFLYEHKYLPPKVWRLIESIYHWMSNELEFYNKYEVNKAKEIIKIMKNPNELDYNTICNSQKLHFEETIDSFELINKAAKVCSNGIEDKEF